MSRWVHTELIKRHALTKCSPRITTTILEGLSMFREGEEKRFTQSVFSQVSTLFFLARTNRITS